MSDISTPTAPVEPPAPTQVTIPETGPASQHGEVGQQTPSKSPEQIAMDRAADRRGSLERALERAKTQAAERADKDTSSDKPRQEATSRDRPRQETPQQPTQRQLPDRGERGRFASSQPPATGEQPAATPSRYAPLAENAPYRDAPPRFDQRAKGDWAGVPESVRATTTKAFQQYERGIQQLQHQSRQFEQFYAPLREFHQQAHNQGTTLHDVLGNYRGMENMLRDDFFGGLDLLINNLDMRTTDGRKATARDVAYHILNMSPEQHRLTQQQNYTRAQAMHVGQLQQQVHQLANGMQQMHYQQRFATTMSEIDRFAATHPRFDEVSGHIKRELDLGFPLPVAYNRAIALAGPANGSHNGSGNGTTHAAQTRNAPAQTREEIDRSISGAPDRGGQSSPRREHSKTNREALQKAVRRVRQGV